MSIYLEKAAEELEKASALSPVLDPSRIRKHLDIAREYRMLAAIESGPPPGDAAEDN